MRYIDKSRRCPAFDSYTKPSSWGDFNDSNIKLQLHQHLLQEQQYLCVYCQQSIPPKLQKDDHLLPRLHPSHIEHIRPKDAHQYPHLAFDYGNLTVSCNGFDTSTSPTVRSSDFCGHPKNNDFDDAMFLHPCENPDIEKSFEYDINGSIAPSHYQTAKAQYTINLLQLNHVMLRDMRQIQYELVIEDLNDGLDVDIYLDPNQPELPKFYSMLKQLLGTL